MMHDKFDKDGAPISLVDWGRLLGDVEYKRVAWDELPGGGHLSTVWLGLDHSFGRGPPLIFETMDFPENEFQERYATLEEAKAGHARILAELRARK